MVRKILTVYIGRFQPFHLGHAAILEQALKSSDKVLVLVGSSFVARTIKNPFTFTERAAMICDWFVQNKSDYVGNKLRVLPLRDQPYNNAKWFQSVQEAVDLAILEAGWKNPDVEVRLTGSARDESTWYLDAFPQYVSDLKPAVPPGKDLSGTHLRERLFNTYHSRVEWPDVPLTTYDFLSSFINTEDFKTLKDEYHFIEKYKSAWKMAPYAPTFVTADAVVIQSGHVLVVKRGALPGKGLWALPGGFVKQHQTVQQAAIEEVVEETGLRLAEGKKALEITKSILEGSIKGSHLFDAPQRSLRGRTITTAYLMRLDDTRPLPKVKGQFAPPEDVGGRTDVVETADAFWVPISDARAWSEHWFEDHHAILDTMLGMIKD